MHTYLKCIHIFFYINNYLATGLEALAEEEDEEYGISDDSISDV